MNRITDLYKIKYPIIQAGMIWCSGWRLAAAVCNAGGLGLIGSGSMTTDLLKEHIRKCRAATVMPFGVNIPLIYSFAEDIIRVILEENVKIVFTSAGSPSKWTSMLKNAGIIVTHVVSNTKFAKKAEEAGVDAIVAEGFEAGGHNGIEETTTMTLIPMIRECVRLPVIAAGGIATGRSMLAAFALGAEGVQIGSRFVASLESSAHSSFKQKVVDLKDGDTQLVMKKVIPVRLIKNRFYQMIQEAENSGVNIDQLKAILGRGRAKKGMFEGDLDEGELEIGQVSGLIKEIRPAGEIVEEIMDDFYRAKNEVRNLEF